MTRFYKLRSERAISGMDLCVRSCPTVCVQTLDHLFLVSEGYGVIPLLVFVNQIHFQRIEPALVVIEESLAFLIVGQISIFRIQAAGDECKITKVIQRMIDSIVIPLAGAAGCKPAWPPRL